MYAKSWADIKKQDEFDAIYRRFVICIIVFIGVLLGMLASLADAGQQEDRACELLRQAKTVRYLSSPGASNWETIKASSVYCEDFEHVYLKINIHWVNLGWLVGLENSFPEFIPESRHVD